MTATGDALGVLAAVAGVLLLHRAWETRSAPFCAAGWGALALGPFAWRLAGAAADLAIALAALAPSLAALAVLALKAPPPPWRDGCAPGATERAPAEPGSRPGYIWRGLARAACVGPLSGAAALGLAAAVAARGAGGAADRLVAAGMVTPLAWAAGGVWATTDARIARVALGLAGAGAAGLALARL